jgi:hypothetical protein
MKTRSRFEVRTDIRRGNAGPMVVVRIVERIKGTNVKCLSPSSFMLDVQGLTALVEALDRAWSRAMIDGLIDLDDDDDENGGPNGKASADSATSWLQEEFIAGAASASCQQQAEIDNWPRPLRSQMRRRSTPERCWRNPERPADHPALGGQ